MCSRIASCSAQVGGEARSPAPQWHGLLAHTLRKDLHKLSSAAKLERVRQSSGDACGQANRGREVVCHSSVMRHGILAQMGLAGATCQGSL